MRIIFAATRNFWCVARIRHLSVWAHQAPGSGLHALCHAIHHAMTIHDTSSNKHVSIWWSQHKNANNLLCMKTHGRPAGRSLCAFLCASHSGKSCTTGVGSLDVQQFAIHEGPLQLPAQNSPLTIGFTLLLVAFQHYSSICETWPIIIFLPTRPTLSPCWWWG